uniref:Putative ovule protein n=1 Tax=Solanum chacoense TaxID=4108 RepID=A0A0V0GZS7_SOLCH
MLNLYLSLPLYQKKMNLGYPNCLHLCTTISSQYHSSYAFILMGAKLAFYLNSSLLRNPLCFQWVQI